MTLAIVPCADASVSRVIPIEKTDCDHSDDKHTDNHDDCSPFCSCDCCGMSVVVPVLQWFETTDFEQNHIYSFYYSFQYSFDYLGGIWYPPIAS